MSIMSCQNNWGSVLSVDSHGYDYGSHHSKPLNPNAGNGKGNGNGDGDGDDRHSPINIFCDELQPDKNMSLGYGTDSTETSEKNHKAAMKVHLETIERALIQQPSYTQSGQAGAEQTGTRQAGAGQAGAGQAVTGRGRAG